MSLVRLYRKVAVLLMAALSAFAGVADAQIITNIAQATWQVGGQSRSTQSNPVTLTVGTQPVEIVAYRFDANSGTPTTIPSTSCGTGGSIGTAAVAQQALSQTGIAPTSTIRIGEPLVIGLDTPTANRDPAAIDTLRVVLTTPGGDREEVTISETGPNTGRFLGTIVTGAAPMPPVGGDCRLSLVRDERITIDAFAPGVTNRLATTTVTALADPFGYVFDSETGAAVNGARVTLIDTRTGQPATVFGYDGVTPWPSSVITGQPITDGAGNTYQLAAGEYLFPLVAGGQYRIAIEPPAPYTAPSVVPASQLASLSRPDGRGLVIVTGSYGEVFTVTAPNPTEIDIPLDRPSLALQVSKRASRDQVQPGDPVIYTLTVRNQDGSRAKRNVVLVDRPDSALRLRADSIRIDGQPAGTAAVISADGQTITISLDSVAAGATRTITYAMTVRPDAPAGDALNVAEVRDLLGNVARAQANVRISRDTIADRMMLIGRITAGDCTVPDPRVGIPNVRVMLEDGSFAITDAEGRYHFEGLIPGAHVVQTAEETLPEGGKFIDCSRSTRNAGKTNSRFVTGQGGSLIVADFHAVLSKAQTKKLKVKTPEAESKAQAKVEAQAAGADTDWLKLGDGPAAFLFPGPDHNPRAPAVRVVIRHGGTQKVELTANGQAVDPLSFDGTKYAPRRAFAVSEWRAVRIENETVKLVATVRNADGTVAETLEQVVAFANRPARAELVPEKSKLVADGRTRPVLAVRITDARGNPVHSGMTGEFELSAPYESAQAIDAMQSRALTGLGRAQPVWKVTGDDGIALVELAPTMVSGQLNAKFTFIDQKLRREQQFQAWVVPGDQKWTLVGLVEGSVGAKTVADQMERSGTIDSDLGENARVAFYAKGRVLGKYLLTASYDSAKQRDDQPLMGAINPKAYYTVFADGSDRRFDTASREKIYVRLESSTFYVLYGDFDTGFDQTDLARYNRTMTGVKGEFSRGGLHAKAFAAEVGSTHRRDEIQGQGISGPYQLSDRRIIANSERVIIEVRDRFRSEVIVDTRELSRFVDYDIDLLTGTIRFKEPILSRDSSLNPQFIVIDYEVDGLTGGKLNAGLRADYTTKDSKLRVGATLLTDKGEGERTDLLAVDAKARIGADTELRLEAGISRTPTTDGAAWQVELEHHDGKLDVLAYARGVTEDYGVGQENAAERGRRKFGVDARYALTEQASVTASGWIDDALDGGNLRQALQLRGEYRTSDIDVIGGISHFADRLAGGADTSSTVLEGGVTKRLFSNKLELSALSSIALADTGSIDLPARHRFGARYALTRDVRIVGSYEIAEGDAVKARTGRVGVEVTPWQGGRISSTFGQEDVAEYGKRSYAAFGLAQSLALTRELTVDATLDHNRTLGGGIDPTKVINPEHPVASGGHLGVASLAEDFTAATLGATYRKDLWALTMRGELRNGDFTDRRGLTFGAIRQIGEGQVIGSGFTWTHAKSSDGATSEVFDGALVGAIRPADSSWAWLAKLNYRSDRVTNAIEGQAGYAGNSVFSVTGDALSRRLIGSLSANWSPRDKVDDEVENEFLRRSEFGVFVGARYGFDRVEDYNLSSWTLLGGLDARVGIGKHFELGASATVRASVPEGYVNYAVGPNVGVSPTDDVLITVGYNFAGFKDPDFAVTRNTNKGVYVSAKIKFDANSFSFLGLGRR